MAVFLRCHGEVIAGEAGDGREGEENGMDGINGLGDGDGNGKENGESELILSLREWEVVQRAERKRLNELVGYCTGVLGFVRSGR